MTVSLDLHDLSICNNNFFYLEKLREHYPDMKISAFYIPADLQYWNRLMPDQKEEARQLIRDAVAAGWLELIPHGLTHTFGEFERAGYGDMKLTLRAYAEHFKELGVPYVKGFCAPNWLMSKAAIRCLDRHGWWYAADTNQPNAPRAKRTYLYDWDISFPFPKNATGHVAGHGHISGPSLNNVVDCLGNLTHIPPDAKWKFVSELMKEVSDEFV